VGGVRGCLIDWVVRFQVPNAATAPVLILVGAMMIEESKHIKWDNMSEAIPAFLTAMMMPFTYR
jgi:adenine/guanine/hypoxanthine permease